jgi:anti-anti-sigma regulatory factor
MVLRLLFFSGGVSSLTYRIQRSIRADAIVFAISGEMDSEHVKRLHELLDTEGDGCILLDLRDVTLVDREGVQYLASAEAAGVRIVNCPDYVRRWIIGEKRQNQ